MRREHMLRRNMGRLAGGSAVAAAIALIGTAAAAAPISTPASCREAANGLISLLDAKQDDTALYRDTYRVVVNTCGPAAKAPRPATPPSPAGRAQCRDLAATMVDIIEDDAMDSPKFAATRDMFAATCGPR